MAGEIDAVESLRNLAAEAQTRFADWLKRLDEYHERQRLAGVFEGYGPGSVVEMTGAECWLDYFEGGYDPEDALEEDRTYWE